MLSVYGIYAIVILVSVFNGCVLSQSCTSSATCISIYDCPSILSQVSATLTSTQADHLRSLSCRPGTGRYPYVCCPSDARVNEGTPRPAVTQPSNGQGNILPSSGSCGIESFGEKVYSGQDTALDEFPWMALLEYSKPNGQTRSLSCGGVLINQRYVLTAAHCLVGAVNTKVGQLINVRLGEYDLTTSVDCINMVCADAVQNVGIEEIIPHSGFDDNNPNRTNDIGLIRLAQDVTYSPFVQPICLPSTIGASRSVPTNFLQVAGWGRTLQSRQSNKKQKLGIPVVDHETCREKFAAANTFIDDTQLCAGGTYIEDTCDGDSGGPLMKFVNSYWAVEGIVSFGRACGLEGWPGVYTRVSSFEDWITSTMRP